MRIERIVEANMEPIYVEGFERRFGGGACVEREPDRLIAYQIVVTAKTPDGQLVEHLCYATPVDDSTFGYPFAYGFRFIPEGERGRDLELARRREAAKQWLLQHPRRWQDDEQ